MRQTITRDELKAAQTELNGALLDHGRIQEMHSGNKVGIAARNYDALIDQLFTELEQLRGRKPDYYLDEYGVKTDSPNAIRFLNLYEIGETFRLTPIVHMPPETYIVALKDGEKVAVLREGGNG